jgi:branched-chain amino acid transport system permease protein
VRRQFRRVFVVAYAAAVLMPTICGILATSYYGTMDFGAGLMFGLKVLMVAAGGHSNPLKSAGGAAGLGFVETLWTAYGPIPLARPRGDLAAGPGCW